MGWPSEDRGGGDSSGSGRVPAGELRMVHAPAWRAVAARLPAAEEGEVRAVVGEALVEETFSLFEEAESVAGILDDLRWRAEAHAATRKALGKTAERTILEAEIQQLVELIDKLAAPRVPTLAGSPNVLRPKAPAGPKPPSSGGDAAHRRPQAGRSRPSTAGSRPLTAGSRPSTASAVLGALTAREPWKRLGGV